MKQGCFSLYVEQDGIGSFGAHSLEGDREKSKYWHLRGGKEKQRKARC